MTVLASYLILVLSPLAIRVQEQVASLTGSSSVLPSFSLARRKSDLRLTLGRLMGCGILIQLIGFFRSVFFTCKMGLAVFIAQGFR